MMEPFRKSWDQTFLTTDEYKPLSGLMEALCLEVPASRKHIRQAFLKTEHLRNTNSASRESKRACSGFLFHRKTKSLDLDIRNLPDLHRNFMMLEMSQRQSEVSFLSASREDQPSSSNRSLARLTDFLENRSTVLNDNFLTRISHQESNGTTLSSTISNVVPSQSQPVDAFQPTAESTSAQVLQPAPTRSTGTNQWLTKREINKQKRTKQGKKKKLFQKHRKINISNLRTEDEEDEDIPEKDSYTCAVCLDVYFNPYMCHPCCHVFCEPCLRTLARDNPTRTPCPLCRARIAKVRFQTDLSKSSAALFPNEYVKRKETFNKARCAMWRLPSCNRLFRGTRDFLPLVDVQPVLWAFAGTADGATGETRLMHGGDFRRRMESIRRRQFPHADFRFDFEDESNGWRVNLDMIMIYFYSMNWVIGFIVFCLLYYYFFLSV